MIFGCKLSHKRVLVQAKQCIWPEGMRVNILVAVLCIICGVSRAQKKMPISNVPLNQFQWIGSHNSYKPGIEPSLYQLLYRMDSNRMPALEYGHIALLQQLDLGLRNLELDVVHDPVGGRYSKPAGLAMQKAAGIVPAVFDTAGDLNKPGLKVFHMQDIDFRSHHLLFTDCLLELKAWSAAHPNHFPVIITINAKDDNSPGLAPLLPFTAAALDSIDKAIGAVFNSHQLITPDLIRGKYKTLREAVVGSGWPTVDRLAGRFLFVLDETGRKRDAYISNSENLAGKLMFVNAPADSPYAAILIINDAKKQEAYIRELVAMGFMVRTRADANTIEARQNNYESFEAAKRSGAQIITTDYYQPSRYFPSTYKVVFDDGSFIRTNPITGKR